MLPHYSTFENLSQVGKYANATLHDFWGRQQQFTFHVCEPDEVLTWCLADLRRPYSADFRPVDCKRWGVLKRAGVYQRVLFKIAVLVFQCLAGQAPSYLSDDCQPVSDSRPRRLRSSDSLTCVVRRAHKLHEHGDRCFATAGPRVWNSLPAELQQCDSLMQFKRCLKTFSLGRGTTALCDFA